jgi:hypothetical protein
MGVFTETGVIRLRQMSAICSLVKVNGQKDSCCSIARLVVGNNDGLTIE